MRAPGIHAIVFDMDGTLLDSFPVVIECYRETVVRFDGPDVSPEEMVSAFAIGPATRMLETLIGRSVGGEAVAWYEARLATAIDRVAIYPGVRETLARLSVRTALGVFTAADTSAAELLLTATGLRGSFEVVLGADRAARPKPAPDGLIAVCDALGCSPEQVAYVGDGPSDIEVARACGALAVAAGWGHLHADGRGADVTLRRPEDLLDLPSASAALEGAT
jgi:HAD superfamily hydrolase (TIGR01509 family)